MSVSDKVNIQLEVTGGVVSAQEVDRVNKALQQMGVDATTASEVGKKLSANNKDVKEGLQALALAAAQVSPAAAEAVRGFSALKLAQEGLAGVSKNLGAAITATWAAITAPASLVIAALGSILLIYHKLSEAAHEWEESQRKASESAIANAEKVAALRDKRQMSAKDEARDIIKGLGALGVSQTPDMIEQIQTRARDLQEAVPTATLDQAMKVAISGTGSGAKFDDMFKALVATSYGVGVDAPGQYFRDPKDKALFDIEQSAARVTPAMMKAVVDAGIVAPVSPDRSIIGAFSESRSLEQARLRDAAYDNALRLSEQIEEESSGGGFFSGTGIADFIGAARVPFLHSGGNMLTAKVNALEETRASARKLRESMSPNYNNCIINNRNGEATGILGKPSESLTPIGGGG